MALGRFDLGSQACGISIAPLSEQVPRLLYLERNGTARAAYMFRYVALPAALWREMSTVALEPLSLGHPDYHKWLARDPEYLPWADDETGVVAAQMAKAYQDLLDSRVLEIRHELEHHKGLRHSVFWIYVNFCLGARRFALTWAVGNRSLPRWLRAAIIRLNRDIGAIKDQVLGLDELRIEIQGEEKSGPQAGIGALQGIKYIYEDLGQLWSVIKRKRLRDVRRSRIPKKLKLIGIVAIFLIRHAGIVFSCSPYLILRFLTPTVFRETTWPLLKNVILRGQKIADSPTIRTFLPNGRQVGLDPAASALGMGFSALSLEACLLREKYSEAEYELVSWWNYVLLLAARDKLLRDDTYYNFVSTYLYGSIANAEDLFSVDRTVHDWLLRNNRFGGDHSIDYIRSYVEARASRFQKLTPEKIFTYIKHHYDHGM